MMPESVAAIAANAERLLTDAKLLATNGSFRTAIALAVLSIEESGKACLALWTKDGHLPSSAASLKRGHINKQRIFGTYRKLKAINSVGKVVEKRDAGDYAHEPSLVKDFARTLDEHARLPVAKADFGLLDHFKQAGFYVDLNERLEVVQPGVVFDQDWFDMVEEDTTECLEMVRSSATDHKIMAVLYSSADELPSPSERHAALREQR